MSNDLLRRFIDKSDVREWLHEPFLVPGHGIAATDGFSLIVVPENSDIARSDGAEKTIQSVAKICERIKNDDSEGVQIFGVEQQCNKCGGTAHAHESCRACAGTGEHSCSCGHEHKCEACEGTGEFYYQCLDCYITIGDRRVARHHYLKTDGLKDLRWMPLGDGITDMVAFKFDGGFGCLMPLRY